MIMKTKWKQFPPEKYRNLASEKLILYSLYKLQTDFSAVKTEDLTACSFSLFPLKFHLKGYLKWPDSILVNTYWRGCRRKGLLIGSGKNGLAITEKGINIVETVLPFLESRSEGNYDRLENLRLNRRTKSKKLVERLINLPVYDRYREDPKSFSLSEHELREILFVTMDASYDLLKRNLDEMRTHTATLSISEVDIFLDILERKLNSFIENNKVQEK